MAFRVPAAYFTGLCLPFLAGCLAPPAPPENANVIPYKQRVKYQVNRDLVFADFILRYTGQSKVIPKQYPRGFIYYNFVVKADGAAQKVVWSSGTGAIGPAEFSVGNKPFWLELQASDTFAHIGDDELVVSPAPLPPKQASIPLKLNPYNQHVKYEQNDELMFQDFVIRCNGKTEVAAKNDPHPVTVYRFAVKANGTYQKVEWRSGGGDVVPTKFKVGGKTFRLELHLSGTSGKLDEGDLMVSPALTPAK